MSRSVTKGKNAEREVKDLIQQACDTALGKDVYRIQRVGYQAAEAGGADLCGVPWLSVEVKHHARTTPGKLEEWWKQAQHQAAPGRGKPAQVAVLAHKENNRPWTFVVVAKVWCGNGLHPLRLSLAEGCFLRWLIGELRSRGA